MTTDPRATALCTSCGLCCTDLPFSDVRLDDAEVAWAKKHRLPLFEREGKHAFRMPCLLLVDRKCSDYEWRPKKCRDFRCNLLVRLDEGKVELDDARAVVLRIRALAEGLLPAERRSEASVERLLDLGELKALVARHIREQRAEDDEKLR